MIPRVAIISVCLVALALQASGDGEKSFRAMALDGDEIDYRSLFLQDNTKSTSGYDCDADDVSTAPVLPIRATAPFKVRVSHLKRNNQLGSNNAAAVKSIAFASQPLNAPNSNDINIAALVAHLRSLQLQQTTRNSNDARQAKLRPPQSEVVIDNSRLYGQKVQVNSHLHAATLNPKERQPQISNVNEDDLASLFTLFSSADDDAAASNPTAPQQKTVADDDAHIDRFHAHNPRLSSSRNNDIATALNPAVSPFQPFDVNNEEDDISSLLAQLNWSQKQNFASNPSESFEEDDVAHLLGQDGRLSWSSKPNNARAISALRRKYRAPQPKNDARVLDFETTAPSDDLAAVSASQPSNLNDDEDDISSLLAQLNWSQERNLPRNSNTNPPANIDEDEITNLLGQDAQLSVSGKHNTVRVFSGVKPLRTRLRAPQPENVDATDPFISRLADLDFDVTPSAKQNHAFDALVSSTRIQGPQVTSRNQHSCSCNAATAVNPKLAWFREWLSKNSQNKENSETPEQSQDVDEIIW